MGDVLLPCLITRWYIPWLSHGYPITSCFLQGNSRYRPCAVRTGDTAGTWDMLRRQVASSINYPSPALDGFTWFLPTEHVDFRGFFKCLLGDVLIICFNDVSWIFFSRIGVIIAMPFQVCSGVINEGMRCTVLTGRFRETWPEIMIPLISLPPKFKKDATHIWTHSTLYKPLPGGILGEWDTIKY